MRLKSRISLSFLAVTLILIGTFAQISWGVDTNLVNDPSFEDDTLTSWTIAYGDPDITAGEPRTGTKKLVGHYTGAVYSSFSIYQTFSEAMNISSAFVYYKYGDGVVYLNVTIGYTDGSNSTTKLIAQSPSAYLLCAVTFNSSKLAENVTVTFFGGSSVMYIEDLSVIGSAGVVPTDTPPATPTAAMLFMGDVAAVIIPLIIVLACALFCWYFAGAWGFFAGLNVGAILTYIFLGETYFPAWAIFMLAMVDIAALIGKVGFSGGGGKD